MSDVRLSLEKAAIHAASVESGMPWQDMGWKFSLRRLYRQTGRPDFLLPLIGAPIRPDAHHMEAFFGDGTSICILEIEDTHPLTKEKLRLLCELWHGLYLADGPELKVFVADRYGMSVRQLPLKSLRDGFVSQEEMAA